MFLQDWLITFRVRLSNPYRQRRRKRLIGGSTEALESRVMLAGAIGEVTSFSKISDTAGNFTANLDDFDFFGSSVTNLGDLDGDGIGDLAVGVERDDDGGSDRGAVYVLFLNMDGTVKSYQKISDTAGGFTAALEDGDRFGNSLTNLGDIDGDGISELAVGAHGDNDGGSYRGAVFVLFLNADGSVKSHQKISDTSGNFTATLDDGDFFGSSLTNLGDFDGDGVTDMAVGADLDDDGGNGHGAVYVLFLNSDGTVKSHQKISDTAGNFTATLNRADSFGSSLTNLGDLDGDGFAELAVGARLDDDGGDTVGAVYVLFLNANGTVKTHQKISAESGNFTASLNNGDDFGSSLTNLGDIDGDGITDLAVGADNDDDGGGTRGAVYVLFLNSDGTVKSHQKISDTQGNFTATLDNNDYFGHSLTNLGDLDGDGVAELVVGTHRDDDGGSSRGAVYILSLEGVAVSDEVIYVNDDFTLPLGAVLTDADPNTPGDQTATMGMNAFLTIQAAIAAVGVDGEILITDDLSTDGPGLYAENLVIESNLTIRATEGDPSAVVIDGGDAGSVVKVDAGVTAVIEAVTIRNGTAAEGGGVHVLVGADVDLNSVIVRDSVATGLGGGGIFNAGGEVTLNDSTVRFNRANGPTGSGGGLYNAAGGTLAIVDSLINGNDANASGGGIEDQSGAAGGVQVTDTNITGNESGLAGMEVVTSRSGGGVHVGNGGSAQFLRGTLSQNTSNGGGGGLWVSDGATVAMEVTQLNYNVALGTTGEHSGGGIWNDESTLDLVQVVVRENTSHAIGPGAGGGGLFNNGSLSIVQGGIGLNIAAAGDGGGILNAPTGTIFEERANITINQAAGNGGGISNNGGTVMLSSGTFISSNTATLGGGYHQSGAGHTTVQGRMEGNTAATGGAIWNSSQGTITFEYAGRIAGNTATGTLGGGGVYNDGGVIEIQSDPQFFWDFLSNSVTSTDAMGGALLSVNGTLTINRSVFANNSSAGSGGAIALVGGSAEIVDVFVGSNESETPWPNTANDSGGGIYVSGGATLTMSNSHVVNNTATRGGGVYSSGVAKTYIDDSSINGNTASDSGGGVWNSAEGLLVIRNGAAINNNTASGDDATQGGGGVFNNGGRLAVFDATISHNAAEGTSGIGGGVLSADGTVTFEGATVAMNQANRSGGGIELLTGLLQLTDTDLDGNEAGPSGSANPGNGGGLHVGGVNGRVTITNSRVTNNTAASEGGGLWNQNGNVMVVRDGSMIVANTASGDAADAGGGGIYNDAGRLAIHSGVTISNNTADGVEGSGGGIFVGNGAVTIHNSLVTGNMANRAGGGIEVVTGFVELRESQVDDNIAGPLGTANPGNGGGLHITGRIGQVGHVSLYGGTVSSNQAAAEGGGIWSQGPTVLVVRDGTVINGNQASGNGADQGGGGIFNNSGRLALLNATVSNNAADGDAGSGGGLFVVSGGVTIEGGSMISHNMANRAGGGIEVQTGQLILVDSTLSDNDAGTTGTANPGNGGGLHVGGASGAHIDLRNTQVARNTAASEGGGLWHQTSNVMLVRAGSQVTGNTAAGDAADEGGGGIYNNGGRLVLNGATIDGNSADGTSGSGGGLLLFDGVTTIEGSTISNNKANRAGGGIEIVNGQLITVDMSLTGNMAGLPGPANPGNGGGLHVTGATQVRTTIIGGEVSANTAAAQGGGLWNETGSILVISDGTTISQNRATGASSNDGGGGLFNNGGRVAISSASIWGNLVSGVNGSGGGIRSTGGIVTLDNSTVSGNRVNGDGGGIANSGELITANATIANNRSDADGTGSGIGGGIWNDGTVRLKNTIVAGNLVGSGNTFSDLAGVNVHSSSRNNLIADAPSSGGLVDGNLGNIVGNGGTGFVFVGSILDPLGDNGGPTLSHSLAAGSLAIDHGSNTAATDIYGTPLQRDQRGIGFPRISNSTVDIGSIES